MKWIFPAETSFPVKTNSPGCQVTSISNFKATAFLDRWDGPQWVSSNPPPPKAAWQADDRKLSSVQSLHETWNDLLQCSEGDSQQISLCWPGSHRPWRMVTEWKHAEASAIGVRERERRRSHMLKFWALGERGWSCCSLEEVSHFTAIP